MSETDQILLNQIEKIYETMNHSISRSTFMDLNEIRLKSKSCHVNFSNDSKQLNLALYLVMDFGGKFGIALTRMQENVTEELIYVKLKRNDLQNIFSLRLPSSRKDHKCRGFGFVYFNDLQSALKARQMLHKETIFDTPLRVSLIVPGFKKENNVFFRNIDPKVTSQEFDDYLSKFGILVATKIERRGEEPSMGTGQFLHENDAKSCREAFERGDAKIGDLPIKAEEFIPGGERPEVRNNLFVKNICPPASAEDLANPTKRKELEDQIDNVLRAKFSEYGEITSTLVKFKEELGQPFAFICFKDSNAANQAMMKADGHAIFDPNCQIECSWAEKKKIRAERLVKDYRNQKNISFQFVYVQNLLPEVTEEQIKDVFQRHGDIISVHVKQCTENAQRTTNYATIKFRQDRAALSTVQLLRAGSAENPLPDDYLALFANKSPFINLLLPKTQRTKVPQNALRARSLPGMNQIGGMSDMQFIGRQNFTRRFMPPMNSSAFPTLPTGAPLTFPMQQQMPGHRQRPHSNWPNGNMMRPPMMPPGMPGGMPPFGMPRFMMTPYMQNTPGRPGGVMPPMHPLMPPPHMRRFGPMGHPNMAGMMGHPQMRMPPEMFQRQGMMPGGQGRPGMPPYPFPPGGFPRGPGGPYQIPGMPPMQGMPGFQNMPRMPPPKPMQRPAQTVPVMSYAEKVAETKKRRDEILKMTQQQQYHILGLLAFKQIETLCKDKSSAPKVTRMILNLEDNSFDEIIETLEDEESLKEVVQEAEEALGASNEQESATTNVNSANDEKVDAPEAEQPLEN